MKNPSRNNPFTMASNRRRVTASTADAERNVKAAVCDAMRCETDESKALYLMVVYCVAHCISTWRVETA